METPYLFRWQTYGNAIVFKHLLSTTSSVIHSSTPAFFQTPSWRWKPQISTYPRFGFKDYLFMAPNKPDIIWFRTYKCMLNLCLMSTLKKLGVCVGIGGICIHYIYIVCMCVCIFKIISKRNKCVWRSPTKYGCFIRKLLREGRRKHILKSIPFSRIPTSKQFQVYSWCDWTSAFWITQTLVSNIWK